MKKSLLVIGMVMVSISFIGARSAPKIVPPSEDGEVINIKLLSTTDLHTNILSYDYFKDEVDNSIGLASVSTSINEQWLENPNIALFDSGDTIQGNPLGDYYGMVNPIKPGEKHPINDVMGQLNFDAWGLGNHEFNYGLEYLDNVVANSNVPVIASNIRNIDGSYRYRPYVLVTKWFKSESGNVHPITIGVMAVAPPRILEWDRAHVEGELIIDDVVESVESLIDEVALQSDIVVVLSHSGISTAPQESGMDNGAYYIAQIEGVDAVLTGHSHADFPEHREGKTPYYKDDAGLINNDLGTIAGVPVTMASHWGKALGVVDMELTRDGDEWVVTDGRSTLVYSDTKQSDPFVENIASEYHQATLEYVRSPVGRISDTITSYFALVMDDPSVQIVNDAQRWYAEGYLAGTKYEGIPILSAAAPFKAGGRQGSEYYTEIPAGEIAIKNVSDLYIYPNTIFILKLTGAEVLEWLEWSAGMFNQATGSDEESIVSSSFRSYNFDVIDGVTYQIDITQPYRYGGGSRGTDIANPDAHRIVNLQFQGEPIDMEQEFIVVTNNYRASTNPIANPGQKNTLFDTQYENKQAIADYFSSTDEIETAIDNNWSLVNVGGNWVFESSLSAIEYANEIESINYLRESSNKGFGIFQLQLP